MGRDVVVPVFGTVGGGIGCLFCGEGVCEERCGGSGEAGEAVLELGRYGKGEVALVKEVGDLGGGKEGWRVWWWKVRHRDS